MCVVIKSRPEFKMGHVGSKTRSLGQFLEKPCVLSRRHSFDPVFMKLCQNDFLTLNRRLSRRAMLSDDSSCVLMEYIKNYPLKISVTLFLSGALNIAKYYRQATFVATVLTLTIRRPDYMLPFYLDSVFSI